VTGKTRPDSGTVTFGERSVSLLKMSEAQIARAGIAALLVDTQAIVLDTLEAQAQK
jgi:ABC-type uncharacterized transport system ATPase subunit